MIYKFTEVLNDLINNFILGDILRYEPTFEFVLRKTEGKEPTEFDIHSVLGLKVPPTKKAEFCMLSGRVIAGRAKKNTHTGISIVG